LCPNNCPIINDLQAEWSVLGLPGDGVRAVGMDTLQVRSANHGPGDGGKVLPERWMFPNIPRFPFANYSIIV